MYQVFLLSSALFLSSCVSNKTAYDTVQTKPDLKSSQRDIANLKNLSKIEDNHYDFISQQMQTLIRNYKKMKSHLSDIEDKLDSTLKKLDSYRYKKLLEPKESSSLSDIKDEIRITNQDNEQIILSIETIKDYKTIMGELIVGDYNTSNEETDRAVKLLKDKLAKTQNQKDPEISRSKDVEEADEESYEEESNEELFEEDSVIEEAIKDDQNLFSENSEELLKKESAKELLQNSSEETESSFMSGKVFFEKGDYEKAVSEFQKYRQKNPEGTHYLEATFYIGQAFKKLQMPIEAQIFFQEIVKTDSDSLWAMKVKQEITD